MANQCNSLLPISLALLLSFSYSTISQAQPTPTPPIAAPTTLPQPPSYNTTDIVAILRQSNSFNTFIRLMKTTQLIEQLNSQLMTIKSGGITILAPEDSAFSELVPGFLNSLSDAKKLQLVQFHVLPDFVPPSSLDTLTNPVRTLAGNKPGKVELNVISYSGSVNISTGPVNTTITAIIYNDNKHVAIYKVGKVLLPLDFFPAKAKAAAPTLAPPPAPAIDEAKTPKPHMEKPNSSSEESSQVVPVETSGAGMTRRSAICGTWAFPVLGAVFAAV